MFYYFKTLNENRFNALETRNQIYTVTWTPSPALHQESIFSFPLRDWRRSELYWKVIRPKHEVHMLHSFQQEKYWPAEHEIKDKEPLLTQLLWPHRDFIAEWLKWSQWSLNWSNHLHQKQWREGNLLKCYRYNQRYFTGELPFSAILYFYSTAESDCLSYFAHSYIVE